MAQDFREFTLACWQFCTHDDANLPSFAFGMYVWVCMAYALHTRNSEAWLHCMAPAS